MLQDAQEIRGNEAVFYAMVVVSLGALIVPQTQTITCLFISATYGHTWDLSLASLFSLFRQGMLWREILEFLDGVPHHTPVELDLEKRSRSPKQKRGPENRGMAAIQRQVSMNLPPARTKELLLLSPKISDRHPTVR